MPLCIAYNHDGTPLDVVLAKSVELATTYWQGRGIIPYSTRVLDGSELQDHPTGVIPLVSSVEKSHWDIPTRPGYTVRLIRRP